MPYEIVLSDIPSKIVAGDSLSWKKSLSDYPASTWTLVYHLLNQQKKITITAAADGDDHLVEIPIGTSDDYTVGAYKYIATVSDGTERYKIDEGRVEVTPDYANLESADLRTHAEKVLEALEAVIEGKASADQLTYSIAGRSISRYSPDEILQWRDSYQAEVNKERRDLNKEQGRSAGTSSQVKVSL